MLRSLFMRRAHSLLFTALATSAAACGSVSIEPIPDAGPVREPPRADASRPAPEAAAPKPDAKTIDATPLAPVDAGHEAARGDAGVPPVGTLLDVAEAHVILGITNDNYVVYQGLNGLYAQ